MCFSQSAMDRAALQAKTVVALQAMAKTKGLDHTGRKAELIDRLVASETAPKRANVVPSAVADGVSASSSASISGDDPPAWAKQLQDQVAALGGLVQPSQADSAQAAPSKPGLKDQFSAISKIHKVFERIETATVNSVIKDACAEGKALCAERMQYLRIADVEGFDVAAAFAREPLVSSEEQRKRLTDARASVRRARSSSVPANYSTRASLTAGRPAYMQHQVRQQHTRVCYVCQNPGHIARFCPNASGAGRPVANVMSSSPAPQVQRLVGPQAQSGGHFGANQHQHQQQQHQTYRS